MTEPVKIASLELENVKRVRAVSLRPEADGLTVIGGRNGQGKTSVLDAIAWALGGERKRPERPTREGSANPASLRVELSNGLVCERSGKNGSLKVTDPEGKRAGQQLVNAFVEELALDLPKFMAMGDREKADELLKVIGVGDELRELDRQSKQKGDLRLAVGQQKRAKEKVARDAEWYPDAPDEPVSAAELITEQQGIMARNAENEAKRRRASEIGAAHDRAVTAVSDLEAEIERLGAQLSERKAEAARLGADLMAAKKTAEQLRDESTAEVEAKLAEIDSLNEKVRANRRRDDMMAEADQLADEYRALGEEVASIREKRMALLKGAELPLPGLDVDERGRLLYKGATWGEMSGSEQLRVATAVVRSLKPECGFVLVDKLEQMDAQTLAEFGSWAESQGLQVIGTRVATDDSCTVVIEDGRVAETVKPEPEKAESKKFTEGVF